jgi:hypothetical protein
MLEVMLSVKIAAHCLVELQVPAQPQALAMTLTLLMKIMLGMMLSDEVVAQCLVEHQGEVCYCQYYRA